MDKNLLSALFLLLIFFSVQSYAQTLYVPSSVTDAFIPGANTWFGGPSCCDLGHTRDNSAMTGTGLAAIHEACDDCCYFNEFGISSAYSPAQAQNPATVLPGFNVNFAPGQTMNALVAWNTCFLQPMQGHYANDANIRQFNMVITHGAGTANLTGFSFANSLTNCGSQVILFGTT